MERRDLLKTLGAGAVASTAAIGPAAMAASASPKQTKDAGKIAVITGVSSGIGQATALVLAERGVNVIGTFRNNEPGARKTAEEAAKLGAKVTLFHMDLNFMDSIAKFQANVAQTLKQEWKADAFDYLVNNAGIAMNAPFAETTEAMFDELYRVDLKGHFFMTQGLLPLIKDGAAIVNVASASTLPTSISTSFSAYGAMKGGLTTLTRYMAKELAPRHIRVNSVAPGPTRTRLNNDGFAKYPEVIPGLAAETALQRIGEPVDLGRAIATILSGDFGWVTGDNIEVSGGYHL